MASLSLPYPFIFCIPEVFEAPDPATHPVGITWETLFRWYYRVKQWDINAASSTISAQVTGSEGSATAGIGDFADSTNAPLTTSEKEFACSEQSFPSSGDPKSSYDEYGGDTEVGFAQAAFNVVINQWFGLEGIVKYDGLYYPVLEIGLGASVSVAFSDGVVSENYSANLSTSGSGTPTTIGLQIDGESFTLPVFLDESGATGGHISASFDPADFPIIITPTSFWPYDPGDGGGPVWDSSTGAQLRNPFSVQ